ncbi:hypothetical protein QLL95_gp1213 [Cotonvirus japonicus]|uniref:Apple domain-containing protein n=1 Tax=Cotonvirus japonicus TaxID=2811091 RepID=A0ABM7NRX1_9VIRU|nr:hypothetical protein QLL95_gp1213 [Cotonvirus japonicus]BCS82910.1 hypothetical protein [Cotonvirus japonicus]
MNNPNDSRFKLLDNVRQIINQRGQTNTDRTNKIMIDGKSVGTSTGDLVTLNRFGNATKNNHVNQEPYYVSGVPATQQNNLVVGSVNRVPFNGTPVTRTSMYMPNTDCPGFNTRTFKVPMESECQNSCVRDNDCKLWSYDKRNNYCYLKNKILPCNSDNNYSSGRIITGSTPVQPNQPQRQVQPNQPSQPQRPVQPNQPSQPQRPVQPSQPQRPVQPNQPSQPQRPVQPNQPSQSTVTRISSMIPNVIHTELMTSDKSLRLSDPESCKFACINDNQCGSWVFIPSDKIAPGQKQCQLYNSSPSFVGPAQGGAYGVIYNQLPL